MTVAAALNLTRNGATLIHATTSTDLLTTPSAYLDDVGGTSILAAGFTTDAPFAVTATGYVKVALPQDEKIGFIFSWVTTSTGPERGIARLHVSQGEERRGWQEGQGEFTLDLVATGGDVHMGKRYFIGPLESARFARVSQSTDAGVGAGSSDVGTTGIGIGKSFARFYLTVTTSSDGQHINYSIAPFRMPVVTYDT